MQRETTSQSYCSDKAGEALPDVTGENKLSTRFHRYAALNATCGPRGNGRKNSTIRQAKRPNAKLVM